MWNQYTLCTSDSFIFPSNVFVYNKSLTINNSSGVSLFYHCFYPLSTAYQTIVPFFKYNYHSFFQINRLRSTSARCVNNSISSLFLFPTGSYCLLLTPTVSRTFRRQVAIHTIPRNSHFLGVIDALSGSCFMFDQTNNRTCCKWRVILHRRETNMVFICVYPVNCREYEWG